LQIISGADAVNAFIRDGWRFDRQKGSHAILVKTGHIASLSIPQHRELAPGTLRSLIRAAGLSVEEFNRLL
jgi:predicted RNA binding protein YcfA (HicA-like mRNA interferase family)